MHHTQLSLPSETGDGEQAVLNSEDQFLLAVAADRPDLLPNELPDIDCLTAQIREHRLEGRCRRQRDKWKVLGYKKSLFTAVDALCEETHRTYIRNKGAAEALSAEVYPDFGVVIKGFSTYLLTGDPATLRCGDIDLVVADSIATIKYLLRSGFSQTRAQFLHEIGEFSRDGIEFDLQWGFPVSRYPDGLNQKEWQIYGSDLMPAEYITADFIQQCSVSKGGRIRIPTSELAVLIATSHAFMNFSNIWSISHREKAWLRLAEFADILDLQSNSNFSPVRFRELLLRFRAQDVISWAESIWMVLSGRALFPNLDIPLSRSGMFPFSLWWNLWIRLNPPSPLLLRRHWFPIGNVVQMLEKQLAGMGRFLGHIGTEPETLPLLWEAADCRGRFHFLYSSSAACLRLIVGFDAASHTPRVRVRIDCGIWTEEITADLSGREISMSDSSIPVRARINDARITLEFQLTGTQLEGSDCAYLGVAVEENGRIGACTAFPFRLRNGRP